MTRRQAVGFLLAFGGAAVVIVAGAGGSSFDVDDIVGAALGLITPVAWAFYTILLKRISGAHPLTTVGTGLSLGTVFLVVFFPTTISVAPSIPIDGWLWLLYLAFLGTTGAYLIWYRALTYLDANQTAAYMYLVPVFALVWSLIILGDAPPAVGLAGGALVFVGVALTQRRAATNPVHEHAKETA